MGTILRAIVLIPVFVGAAAAQRKDAPPAKPVVTSVSAAVDLPSYQGPCPGKLIFAGTIITAVVPKAPITYQWVRSDGVKGPKRTLTMKTTAEVVTDVWKIGISGEMMRVWQELRILSPTVIKSNQATAAVLCR